MATETKANWTELLNSAVTQPGMINEAYTRFHNYSMGNQILAMFQCAARDLKPGPIGTFMHWKENGRFVRKGERAIQLCMPVTHKRTDKDEAGNETVSAYTSFIYRNNWFVLSQTDGDSEYVAPAPPDWDADKALSALDITRMDFDALDGNIQGYAIKRSVAVSPVAALPFKTLFHEIAHVLLGHTSDASLNDGAELTKDVRELEAEAVALLCCESLGMPGAEYSRGYIQSWFKGSTVPERSAQRIFHAADQILKAGVK